MKKVILSMLVLIGMTGAAMAQQGPGHKPAHHKKKHHHKAHHVKHHPKPVHH